MFFLYTYPPTTYSLSGTGNYASLRALVLAQIARANVNVTVSVIFWSKCQSSVSGLLNSGMTTHEETCFLVFCCLYVGIPGHTSDPLVEFRASDTSFAEGNVWNEASLWCSVLTMGYHKPNDFDITETCCNRKFWLYICVGSASATSINASNTLCCVSILCPLHCMHI